MLVRATSRAVLLTVLVAGALYAGALTPTMASARTTWLCAPATARNPCLSSELTTVELANGSSYAERSRPSKRFDDYLVDDNDGRGFVLIGDSQGAAILTELIREQIDPDPLLRAKLVSAVLLGGNVIVPEGKTVGGSFQHIPTCQSERQTSCVIAFSSFLQEPPPRSYFGRATNALTPNAEVACVNPTLPVQDGQAGSALGYYPTEPFPGPLGPFAQVPKGTTPWVATPGEYSAQCEKANGASWLQLTRTSSADPREMLLETLGPLWGTHLDDFNVAMGNLVAMVGQQASSYLSTH
jgi:hypothetical protein